MVKNGKHIAMLRTFFVSLCFGLAINAVPLAQIYAQEGFEKLAKVSAKGDEQTKQPNLWMMEVHMKSLRMIWVPLKDKYSGEIKKEPVYYLCYRATNRKILNREPDPNSPQNKLDPVQLPPHFIPKFSLVGKDIDKMVIYEDQIVPEAQELIVKAERKPYANSVEVVQAVPAITAEKPTKDNSIYGVAIFRGVDMNIDKFKIYLEGFSNGYEITDGPDGKPLISRKTLVQQFWRKGDRFDPALLRNEVDFVGEPEWIYRPESAPLDKITKIE